MANYKKWYGWISRLSTRKSIKDDQSIFFSEIVLINFNRIRILGIIMFLLFSGLILFDYVNMKAGKWALSPGYKIVFYSHVSAFFLLLVFSGHLYFKPIKKIAQVQWRHRLLNQTMIALFCFHMSVISLGDTFINGSLAAYMGSIFAIASFVFTSNGFALQLFLSNTVLMVCLLSYASAITGESYSIQIINAVIYGFISYLLSRLLFYYQLKDFSNRRLIREQNERLEKLAMTDHLTGVLNRRSFLEQAQNEIQRSIRYNYPLGVAILDIDFFKKVNDTYGHATGDAVLVFVSRLLKDNVRSSDLLARWGGEEFILLSVETGEARILQKASSLRSIIETNKPENGPGITASFGVTCYRRKESIDTMINRADMALYEAKKSGRNCVKSH